MRTKIIVYAALLSLGFVIPAWAAPRTLPASPAQEKEAPLMSELRQERVTPPVPSRGQMLYENHCMSCHDSVVHIRGNRRTRSQAELRGQVLYWANALHLHWGKEEVEEVATHLNAHYYKFEFRQK